MRLAQKVAIVTGAAHGIGRASAERFAAEGATVVLADVAEDAGEEAAAAIRSSGARASFIRTDVSDPAALAAMVDGTLREYGRIDILFNNAGIGRFVRFEDLTIEEWDRVFAIDLRATFVACRLALPHLRQTTGVILNTSSQSGHQGQAKNEAYCAAKAGVILFTRSLARELAPEGIRVNCLCPGDVETPMLPADAKARGLSHADYMRGAAKRPLGRVGTPEELAKAALFLASDDSSFMTGAALVVDGGGIAD